MIDEDIGIGEIYGLTAGNDVFGAPKNCRYGVGVVKGDLGEFQMCSLQINLIHCDQGEEYTVMRGRSFMCPIRRDHCPNTCGL